MMKYKIIIATTSIINAKNGLAQMLGPQESELQLGELLK